MTISCPKYTKRNLDTNENRQKTRTKFRNESSTIDGTKIRANIRDELVVFSCKKIVDTYRNNKKKISEKK